MELTIDELELLLEALDTEGTTAARTSGVSVGIKAGAGRLAAKVKTELHQRCLSAGLVRDLDVDRSKPLAAVPHETVKLRKLREVLELLAGGKTNAEIASQLHVSPQTVENYRVALMQRRALQDQTELIRRAMRHSCGERIADIYSNLRSGTMQKRGLDKMVS